MTTKLLLDTSYLLPILGIEIKGLQKALTKLMTQNRANKIELYFSRISLFEALAKISKLDFDDARVQTGLQAILDSEIIEEIPIPIEAYLSAMQLKKLGFRDFIDLLLFETARTNNLQFLTRDKPLFQFISEKTKHDSFILFESAFLK